MDTKPIGASSDSVEETHEAILRRFEKWLDEALAEEEPPPGLPAELRQAILSGEPLPPKLGREIQAVLDRGVSAEEIMEEIMAEMEGADVGEEPETGDSRRSAPKRTTPEALPEQGNLF